MKKILLFSLLAIMFYNCKKKNVDPIPVNSSTPVSATIPENYILKNGTYYEFTEGEIYASLYDGGPNYHIVIWLNNNKVSFKKDTDEVDAFSGVGNGFFVNLITTDSLVTGNYTAMEGWIGFNNFNYNNPPDNIYDLNNLPSNFIYLDDKIVSFTKLTDSTYNINMDNSEFKLHYSGKLKWVK